MATPSFLTGVSGPRELIVQQHRSSLFFPRMQIPRTAVHRMQAQRRALDAAFVEVSPSNGASQHGSTAAVTWGGGWMRTPGRGLAAHPLSAGAPLAGSVRVLIQRLYFHSPAVDRDAQRPRGRSAAVSERVGVTAPAKALIISADIMRKGAMLNSVIAVCCLTHRLGCF